ncbi:MAG: hypothetical protein ACLQLH_17325 [Terracidiphilus sp.]
MDNDKQAVETPAAVADATQDEYRFMMENMAKKCEEDDKALQDFRRKAWVAEKDSVGLGIVRVHPDASLSGGKVIELLRGCVRGLSSRGEPRLTFNTLGLVGDARSHYAEAMEERGFVAYEVDTTDSLDASYVVTELGQRVCDALGSLEFPAV